MAWAVAVADTPASKKITRFSGEVMDTSNAAVLPQNQLGSSMSAGWVLLWSLLKFWLEMQRKPGETIQELAARIRHDAVRCDFPSIKNPQDEVMRTRFMC